METKNKIVKVARSIFAKEGYKALGLREIAKKTGIATSVLYYYFKDKDALLKEVFDVTNTELGLLRAKLPVKKNATEMLKQRIEFQLDHSEMILVVLKYYIRYRKTFVKNKQGFVPEKAYLHILEVLRRGVEEKEFFVNDVDSDAKVITHAINGFVLEYYPDIPRGVEKKQLVDQIFNFIYKSLSNKERKK